MRPTRFLPLATITALLLAGCGAQPQADEATPAASPEPSVTSAEPTPHVYRRHLTWEELEAGEPSIEAAEDERRQYRPPSDESPAQNVPRPQMPQGMNEDTEEGLIKFIYYWISLAEYGTETGDFTELYSLSGDLMVEEYSRFATTARHYREGGWVDGGLYFVYLLDYFEDFYGDGTRVFGTLTSRSNERWYGGDDVEFVDNTAWTYTPTFFLAKFVDGRWVMEDIQEKREEVLFLEGQSLGVSSTGVAAYAVDTARDSFED